MRRSGWAMVARMCILATVSASGAAGGQQAKPPQLSQGTPEHWAEPGWWPTKGTSTHGEYAGTAACAKCHSGIAATQRLTPMFQAASLPSEAEILKKHPEMHFSDERYDYLLARRAGETVQTVNSKAASTSAPVGWAFGVGEVAQTYLFKRGDSFLESRLSYYTQLGTLGITTGHDAEAPETIEQAIGDAVDAETVRRCFGCHTTASTVGGIFDPEHATMGVTCEACHGPGVRHVAAMTGSPKPGQPTQILNPRVISPVDSVDYCGACHRTPVDVAVYVQSDLGVAAVRFQPYRLERSLCWGVQGDRRITCVACHDPHKPLVRGTAAYDANCLRCHVAPGAVAEKASAPACKVATRDCASCHMPKVEVSATHATFTDHFIRVVRPGSGFRQ